MPTFSRKPIDDLGAALRQTSATGSTNTSKANDPPVYMGGVVAGNANPILDRLNPSRPGSSTGNPILDILHPAQGRKVPSPAIPGTATVKTQSEAMLEFYQWSPDQRDKWGDYLVSVGYLPASKAHDYNSLRTAWNDVIEQGAAFTAAGKFLTPKDVAKLMARGSDSSGSGSGGYTGTKSATSKSVDLTDPETAKAMVNDILSNALGRAALPEELATFRQTLNAAEKANPVTTTTTGTYQDGDQVSQTSTRSGGLDSAGKQQVLLDEAKKTPEYGAYQAARMVLGWLGQAIAAPV